MELPFAVVLNQPNLISTLGAQPPGITWTPPASYRMLGNVLFFQDSLCMFAWDSWQPSDIALQVSASQHAPPRPALLHCFTAVCLVRMRQMLFIRRPVVSLWLCTCRFSEHFRAPRCGTFVSGHLALLYYLLSDWALLTLPLASEKWPLMNTGRG